MFSNISIYKAASNRIIDLKKYVLLTKFPGMVMFEILAKSFHCLTVGTAMMVGVGIQKQ
jgi:hypothetical protein